MLDEQHYQSWFRSLGFKRETKELLDQIRSSPPARRVGGGKKNVAGRYPSRKMGVTIQFESHSNEFAAVLEYENDPDCLEFYDQPQPSIPLEYRARNGRQLHVLHTADFFVLRAGSAGWVECKTKQDLVNLADSRSSTVSTEDIETVPLTRSHGSRRERSSMVIPTETIIWVSKILWRSGGWDL